MDYVTGAVGTGFGAVTGAVGTSYNAVKGAVGTGIGTVTGLFSNEQQLKEEAEKKEAAALKAKQEAEQDRANKIKQAAALKAQQEADEARIAAEKAMTDAEAQKITPKFVDSIASIEYTTDADISNEGSYSKISIKSDDGYYTGISSEILNRNRMLKIIKHCIQNQDRSYSGNLYIFLKMDNNNNTTITIPLKSINKVSTYSFNDNITDDNEKNKYRNLAKIIIEQFPLMQLYNPIGVLRNSSDRQITIIGIKKKITIIEIPNQNTNGIKITAPPGSGSAAAGMLSLFTGQGGKRKTRKNKKSKKSTKKNKQKRNKKNKKRKTLKRRKTVKR